MTRLESIISEFQSKGFSTEERRDIESKTPGSFYRIAKELLSGYFEVTSGSSTKRVFPTVVELYYHEEEGNIKDYIVYHRNNTSSKKKEPVFSTGILHNHVSGIDITFEHEDSQNRIIRASALIREYRVEDGESEHRSTQLYADLYSQFSIFDGFSVKWKDGEPIDIADITTNIRKNVAMYLGEKKMLASEHPNSEKTSNKKFVQCQKRWNFSKK